MSEALIGPDSALGRRLGRSQSSPVCPSRTRAAHYPAPYLVEHDRPAGSDG